MEKIAWIGTGVMGSSMAHHLIKNNYDVYVYNRSAEKAEAMREKGAVVCGTIAETVTQADFIFSIVGYPSDVEEVYLSKGGILENAKGGAVICDMTTSSPKLAQEIYEAGKRRNVMALDAPVSGGDSGAKNGTLSIMAGGDKDAFDKTLPLFECMGKNIVYMGGAGMGQHTKAANQIAVAGATAAYTEALVYAENAGLDPNLMLKAIGAGAAGSWQLANMAPRALAGDFAPGFFVKHFIKDMKIAAGEMKDRGVSLAMLETVLSLYEEMEKLGYQDDGTQALIKRYR